VAEIETRRARLEQELEQSSSTLETSTREVEDAKAAHEQAIEAIQPLKENKTELKAQFDGNRGSLTSQQVGLQLLEAKLLYLQSFLAR